MNAPDYDDFTDDEFEYEPPEFNFDGDPCPHCGSAKTIRIDVIAHDPTVWHCECCACDDGFEVLGR